MSIRIVRIQLSAPIRWPGSTMGGRPLRESLLLPDGALFPAAKCLDWHRQKIFRT